MFNVNSLVISANVQQSSLEANLRLAGFSAIDSNIKQNESNTDYKHACPAGKKP